VVKGEGATPLYKWAGEQAGPEGRPKWNFHKYLFGRDGRFIDWFSTQAKPMGPKITSAVKKALA
jgi:glutathione peroxidase